jgi:hypothetical protein
MTEQPLETKKESPLSPKQAIEKTMLDLLKKSDEVSNGVRLPAKEWKMFYRLQMVLAYFPKEQPFHITDQEAEAILDLRTRHNYSIADLAFIFQRSTQTIFKILKDADLTEKEEMENQRVPTSATS